MTHYGYIYMTTNLVNGRKYIGQHKWSKYPQKDPSYIGSGKIIKQSIKKEGKENFSCRILQWCKTEWELNAREKAWILMYDAVKDPMFYNIWFGGGCNSENSIKMWSDNTFREKHKQSMEKVMKTPEYKKNLKIGMNNPTVKEKLSKSSSNNWKNPEYREKVSKGISNRWKDPEYRDNIIEKVKESLSNRKEELHETLKNRWKNPEYRAKKKSNSGLYKEDYFGILKLFYVDGWKRKDIADLYNVKEGTILRICKGTIGSYFTKIEYRKGLHYYDNNYTKPISKNAKLSEKEVLEIYNLKGKMTQVEIAKKYNTKKSTVNNIHNGISWNWLTNNKMGKINEYKFSSI